MLFSRYILIRSICSTIIISSLKRIHDSFERDYSTEASMILRFSLLFRKIIRKIGKRKRFRERLHHLSSYFFRFVSSDIILIWHEWRTIRSNVSWKFLFRSGLESGALHFSNASHYSSRRFLLTSLRNEGKKRGTDRSGRPSPVSDRVK